MSALLTLYESLQARLEGNVALMARVTQVYDGTAPDKAALPLIELGDATETHAPVFDRAGHSDTITLHLYSNSRTRTEALELADLIDAALAAPLALDGHLHARMRREFREALRDPSRAWHVPIRYRLTTFASETGGGWSGDLDGGTPGTVFSGVIDGGGVV